MFSELYSAYYNTVAKIISKITDGKTDEKDLQNVVSEYAFGESVLTILPSLKSGKWQLIHPDMSTPIEHKPTMPMTGLQKKWLKAISLDRRIRLFDINFKGLEDVEPLFTPDDYYIYDQYSDGDPYEDEEYIKKFHVILSAIREKAPIKLNMTNRYGKNIFIKCIPMSLEYSEKDDKFRVITGGCRFITAVNLARINSCSIFFGELHLCPDRNYSRSETLVLKITDRRNALERCMLHFAHFEKQAEKIDKNHYLVRIRYDHNDESEIVIRILSFGPLVEVTEPESLRNSITEKLKKQLDLGPI